MQVLVLLRSTMHQRHIAELCLTGELIDARRAAELGLVNEVAPRRAGRERGSPGEKLSLASPRRSQRGKQAMAAMES